MSGAAAIMLYVTWPEPGALVGPEAMAHGVPIIGSDQGVIPNYICNGVTGFIVEKSKDPAPLAEAMGRWREIDREICHARWESNFTSRRMAEEYLELYKRAVEGESW